MIIISWSWFERSSTNAWTRKIFTMEITFSTLFVAAEGRPAVTQPHTSVGINLQHDSREQRTLQYEKEAHFLACKTVLEMKSTSTVGCLQTQQNECG
ncbi:hypothetical protein Tco_0270167 [Tanacetum coccineum]